MGKQVLAVGSLQESSWRARFDRYAISQRTVEAFCRSEAVSVSAFYAWRARLSASPNPASRSLRALPRTPAPFIELGSVTRQAADPLASDHAHTQHHHPTDIDIRLDLGGGVVLHIARH